MRVDPEALIKVMLAEMLANRPNKISNMFWNPNSKVMCEVEALNINVQNIYPRWCNLTLLIVV
jgi:hypothetical protein